MPTRDVLIEQTRMAAGTRRLQGKVSIVTGAAMGIGRAIAEIFAAEGATLVLCDHDASAAQEVVRDLSEGDSQPLFVQCDVSRTSEVQRLMDSALNQHGRIDVLVNNAGVLEAGSVVDLDETNWDRVMDVNAKGVYLCCRLAIPHMIRAGGGSIVNITSIAGLVGWPGVAGYCASKGAVTMLTKAMALDHVKDKIRVNAIAPGAIWTPMVKDFTDGSEAVIQSMAEQHPMGRIGRPEEIAEAAVFLASDLSSFITGVVLPVDGGYTAR